MPKRVKLSDIAARCGVSIVTVSKALSGQKGVGSELREKIIAMADEMGYVKSSAKEEEGHHKNYTIGVVVAERFLQENQSFYSVFYQEISRATVERDSFAILEVISPSAEAAGELPKVISEKRIDALLVLGQFCGKYQESILGQKQMPVLFLDSDAPDERADCVLTGNLQGGKRMTDYLFSLGHSQIAFVGSRLATSSIKDRFLGYYKSLLEHGIALREDWIVSDRDKDGVVDAQRFFLLPKEMPTSFFCNCDYSANLLIRKLAERGLRVPQDVSVVGFDNYVSDQVALQSVTTYESNTREMAKRAVQQLMKRLEGDMQSPAIYVVPGRFVEKGSARRIGEPIPFL